MKVDDLEGMLLDYWVARAEGFTNTLKAFESSPVPYSVKWEYGGLIIEREHIDLSWHHETARWGAAIDGWPQPNLSYGHASSPSLLTAAMRSYVASKFGEEVPDSAIDAPQERADGEG